MEFDRLVHEAWPAYESREHDGWILRYAGGVTKRANSVLPLDTPADLDAAIAAAEAFYAERGARTAFSLGPGAAPGLDAELERRGYELVDPTLIMSWSGETREPEHPVRIEESPWPAWGDAWWAVDGRHADGRRAVERILTGAPAWYAAVEEDGVPLAVGRAVPQGNTLGVYCMATLPGARRRGLARSVLRALLRRGGLPSAYLVVTRANAAAQALYRSEGFEPLPVGYHYRVR
ncbi:GNAT family N-acetyltransferase [Nonomuraea roseoviolacea subsp. roseoviolacea]|uniref:GNAT family N-acetyltransferase n=1 Tax=Nonomuraea roseoviolacea TaxID=103837 RepID=UPI0031DE2F7B